MANSVDPDETARYEPSQQDLHCLHRYLFWSAGLKGFTRKFPSALDKREVQKIILFLHESTHQKGLCKALVMSTHNIFIQSKVGKILIIYAHRSR